MSSSISITPAAESDIPIILSFIRALAEYERLSHRVTASEEALRTTLFGRSRYAEVIIARLNDEPVGYALYFHSYSTFLAQPGMFLEDLFVLAEHRGRGVGKALLTRVAQIARERDCGRLEWNVLDWNTPAIEFYRRLGATLLPDWRVCRLTADQISKFAESNET
jgi:GNAT superfamily N-acetyltransferase